MNSTRAWHLLSIANQIPDELLDEALDHLADSDVERVMRARRDGASRVMKPVWRAALTTRLRRRLLIPYTGVSAGA